MADQHLLLRRVMLRDSARWSELRGEDLVAVVELAIRADVPNAIGDRAGFLDPGV